MILLLCLFLVMIGLTENNCCEGRRGGKGRMVLDDFRSFVEKCGKINEMYSKGVRESTRH